MVKKAGRKQTTKSKAKFPPRMIEKPGMIPPMTTRGCRAMAKATKKQCELPANENYEVCRKHGANSTGRPVLHGKYSKYLNNTVQKKHEEFLKDKDLKDLTEEVTLLRAAMADFFSKKPDGSFDVTELAVIKGMCESIAKIHKTDQEIKHGKKYTLDIKDAENIISQIVYIMKTEVEDEVTRKRIAKKMNSIKMAG